MKKLLSILTTVLVISLVVAVCATSASAAFVAYGDKFVPRNITIKPVTAGETISIDGNITPDAGYASTPISLDGKIGDTDATCTANLAYDADYLYIHMVVNDTSNYTDTGMSFYSDSIEFYLDFDNNKTMYNKLSGNPNLYAGQFRVQRGGNSIDPAVLANTTEMEKLINKSSVKVTEQSGNAGYVVEIKFNHGKHAISNQIGFALLVNDGDKGSQSRNGQRITNNSAGAEAQDKGYQYSCFLDIATLDGYNPSPSRERAPDLVADDSASSVASVQSKPASSKPASSKPSTSSVSSTASATASGTASATTSDATSTVTSVPAGTTSETVSTDADVPADTDVANSDSTEAGGGLSTGALIGIIAGGVAVLAAAAVVVIIILKKKKA